MNIKVNLQQNPAIDGYDIWVTAEDKNGGIGLAKPIILDFVNVPPAVYAEPTMRLNYRDADDFLTSFATALARAGFKSDELKNTQIEDMRKLVFNLK